MSLGTVFLVIQTFFLLKHRQIKISSHLQHLFFSRYQSQIDKEGLLSIKPLFNLALPFKQFISTSTETIGYPENVANYKYYDIDQIQTLKYPNKLKPPSLIHISVYPLNKDFEDFDFLLSSTNNVFE